MTDRLTEAAREFVRNGRQRGAITGLAEGVPQMLADFAQAQITPYRLALDNLVKAIDGDCGRCGEGDIDPDCGWCNIVKPALAAAKEVLKDGE